ncbi:MAG: hypothetical protein AAF517_17045 [Planctomycetota bacterium]
MGPAESTFERIRFGDYHSLADVATGRFLDDFEGEVQRTFGVEADELRLVGRSRNWVLLTAPYRDGRSLSPSNSSAFVRMQKVGGVWKLEHIWISRRRRSSYD